jgi:chromosome segregation ATPase
MSVKIIPHPRKIQCDFCSSRDTFMITKNGGRAVQFQTTCREDLKSIVEEGLKLFGEEIEYPSKVSLLEDDLTAQLETKNSIIDQLQQKIDEQSSKITELEGDSTKHIEDLNATSGKYQQEIKDLTIKITELEDKLKAQPAKTVTKRPAKTVKGKGGKR